MPSLLARLSLRWRSSEHKQSSPSAGRDVRDAHADAESPPPQRGAGHASVSTPSLLQLSKDVAAPAEATEPGKIDAVVGTLVADAGQSVWCCNLPQKLTCVQ
jgi:hypothetical protein